MNIRDILPQLSKVISDGGSCGRETGDDFVDDGLFSLAENIGAEPASGANMDCLIFETAVVKWVRPTNGKPYHEDSGKDVAFYNSVEAEDLENFASCEQEGEFIIQERVIPIGSMGNQKDIQDPSEFMAKLIEVAIKYNLGDMHCGNIGVRKDDPNTPVIFDYSCRRDYQEHYRQRIEDGQPRDKAIMSELSAMNLSIGIAVPAGGSWDATYKRLADRVRNSFPD